MKFFFKSEFIFPFLFLIFLEISPKNASELMPSGLIFNDFRISLTWIGKRSDNVAICLSEKPVFLASRRRFFVSERNC